jgi:hypothetical protein
LDWRRRFEGGKIIGAITRLKERVMSDHRSRTTGASGVLAALTAVLLSASATAAAPETQLAAWTPKELRFTYQGFTTRYSCDGLRDKVRSALLELGARKDLTVQETACSARSGGPERFPGVTIRRQVLTPLSANAAASDAAAVAAHWKAVDLRLDRDAVSDSGNCELLEQIKQSILPLFSTRNIEYNSTCVPHQLSAGGTRLRVDVLVSDAPDQKPAAAAH